MLKLGLSPMFKLEGGPDATHMSGGVTFRMLVLDTILEVTECAQARRLTNVQT